MTRGGRGIKQDEIIIEQVLAGDEHAFRTLIEKYRNYLYHIVYGVLRNRKDAEDVTQEVFVQIYVSLPQYKFQGLKSWMSRIAVNKAIDYKRKIQRRKENLTDAIEEVSRLHFADDAERPLLEKERQVLVHTMLNRMPANYREVMRAFYLEEKTHKQIAAEQGVAEKTIASKLHRARKWIQKNWREDDFE